MTIMDSKSVYKRDAIHVKAMKIDSNCTPDTRKFSIDPQITTFDVLKSILSKAFEIQDNFTISYRVVDDFNQENYLPMMSDWDLDAAFLSAVDPCLCLRIEVKIYEVVGNDWNSSLNSFAWITERKIPSRWQGMIKNHVEKTFSIVREAFNFTEDVQQAQEVINLPPRPPLNDMELRNFLDPIGQLIKTEEFYNAIYLGGVEPSLRKVVWKHLLKVYPNALSGKQRIDYMRRKSHEYEQLKSAWKNMKNNEQMKEELNYVTGMVKKDVLRTDRQHKFYAGDDDNQNIVSLFNILTTYALNHPSVSYCQGMSDLASPLLVTMGNEAHAYICFCSLMRRLASNFFLDGVAMTHRFQHLSDGLLFYDPTFFAYLKAHQADDLLFCYRWLLLEMKREFAFDDALHMLEVMWSSLPPTPSSDDLPLYEIKFGVETSLTPPPPSPAPRETPYTKVCALRRQTACGKLSLINRSLDESVIARRRLRHSNVSKKTNSLDDGFTISSSIAILSKNSTDCRKQQPLSTASSSSSYEESDSSSGSSINQLVEEKSDSKDEIGINKTNSKSGNNCHRSKNGSNKIVKNLKEFQMLTKKTAPGNSEIKSSSSGSSSCVTSPDDDSGEYCPLTTSMTQKLTQDLEYLEQKVFDMDISTSTTDGRSNELKEVKKFNCDSDEVFLWENPLVCDTEDYGLQANTVTDRFKINCVSAENSEIKHSTINSHSEGDGCHSNVFSSGKIKSTSKNTLPGPQIFGCGNPFLMFLCIAVLCQHRDQIMKRAMDYNEIAMHFDKMVRKHDVTKVLNHARILYSAYLKQHEQLYLKV